MRTVSGAEAVVETRLSGVTDCLLEMTRVPHVSAETRAGERLVASLQTLASILARITRTGRDEATLSHVVRVNCVLHQPHGSTTNLNFTNTAIEPRHTAQVVCQLVFV